MTYRGIITIILVICIIVISILTVILDTYMYHPSEANIEKYDKFYHKLHNLTGNHDWIQNFFVQTDDETQLDTFYIKNPNTEYCAIIVHGNAGNLAMRYDIIKYLYNFASVIIFDYRGYGRSIIEKSKSKIPMLCENNLISDLRSIYSYAVNRLIIEPKKICLYGESIGCSLIINYLSTLSQEFDEENYPYAIILQSPFYSIKQLVIDKFKKYYLSWLGYIIGSLRDEYRSNEYLELINHETKIIIAHSAEDELIPIEHSSKLNDILTDLNHPNSQFIKISGGHNEPCFTTEFTAALSNLFN